MHNLRIIERKDDVKIVARSKKSLRKNFKLSSYKHIDSAVWLALYLYVLGFVDEAKNLLESFVYDVESKEERRDLWGGVGNGILLLAYIYRNRNDQEKECELVSLIINDDIMTDRTTRANLLREEFEYHKERMEWYPNETHKYRCEILAERFFAFLYFYELLSTYAHDLNENEIKQIGLNMLNITSKLENELKSS